MFKTLKAILSTPTQAGSVAGAVAKGLDAAVFTKQEGKEWTLRYLNATLPMNLARRVIALAVTFVWVLLALIWTILTLIGQPDMAAAIYDFMRDILTVPFGLVMALYFGKGVATDIFGGKK
jgi:hypothetical protein